MKFPVKQNNVRSAIQLTVLASAGVTVVGLAMAATAGRAANHPSARAQQMPAKLSANAIIQKMAAHYSKLSSLRVKITNSTNVTMKGKKLGAFVEETLAMQRPDRYAYEISAGLSAGSVPAQPVVIRLSNGRVAIAYAPPFKQYTRQSASSLASLAARSLSSGRSGWGEGATLLLTLFTGSSNGQAATKFLGPVSLAGRKTVDGRPVAILKCSLAELRSHPESSCLLTVDAGNGALVSEAIAASPRSDISLATTGTFQSVSENVPLPASLFSFRPPADARLVDKIQPTFPAARTQAPPAAKVAPMVGKPAPDFSLQDMNGKTVDLNSLKGRTILMDFSASW